MNYFGILVFILLAFFIYFVLRPYLYFKLFVRNLPTNIFVYPYVFVTGAIIKQYLNRQNDTRQEYLKHRFQRYGPNCKAAVLNIVTQNFVILLSPKYIEEFYKQGHAFKKWSFQSGVLRFAAGDGLLLLQNEEYKKQKAIISKVFTFDFLTTAVKKVNEIIKEKVQGLTQQKGFFNLRQSLVKITSSIVLQMFIGIPKLNQKIADEALELALVGQFGKIGQLNSSVLYLLLGKIPGQDQQKRRQIEAACEDLIKSKLQQFKKRSNKDHQQPNILSLLFNSGQYNDEQHLVRQMVQEFKNFLIGGTDTTATLLSFAIYFLKDNTDIAATMRQEAFSFDFTQLNASSGQNLKTINGYLKQIQRLYGPLNNIVSREAQQDLYINDIFVPKGTVVNIDFCYNHYLEQYYKDPYRIRPERWSNGELNNNPPFTFLPFSAGSRKCIGQHLAMLQARLLLIHFLRTVDFEIKQPFSPIVNPMEPFQYFKFPLDIKAVPFKP